MGASSSQRGLPRLARLLLLGTALLGPLAAGGDARAQAAIDESTLFDLPNPPQIVSENGVLRGTLTMAPAPITVDGRTVTSNVINGNYMVPTMRIRRGDTIRVRVVNRIGAADVAIDGPQPTNIHYHGMDVRPKRGDGDNVYIRINPEKELRYDVFVPDNHPQGLHWYHAHVHTYVDDQIGSGISGMLIVGGFIFEQYPELVGHKQRVMVFKDFTFPDFKDGDARAKSLNGFSNPPIRARPGEWQVWQLGNLGADAFFDMKLDGHQFWLMERDGNLLLRPTRVDHLFLPPGARAVVAVRANAAGEYAFRHLNVDTGPAGDPNPPEQLGRFIVSGDPVPPEPKIRERLLEGPARPSRIVPSPATVGQLKPNRTRYVDFSESADGNTFFINNKEYVESRIDTTTRVGQVERWIVRNFSQEFHVFHLHQTEFLIKRFSGDRNQTLGGGLRDVINIPYAQNGQPGFAEILIPFTNPIIAGEFVYHCHLVQHEDAGMMANIRVLPQQTAAEILWEKVSDFAGLDLPALGSSAAPEPPLLAADGEICRPGEQPAVPTASAVDRIPAVATGG
jgi:FtsP/CotA-like multicopper oxidase with cupredoxin domain